MEQVNSQQSVLVEAATRHFRRILEEQTARAQRISRPEDRLDITKLKKTVVGVAGGDGIGPIISQETVRVLRSLLAAEVESGRIELREIEGLTLENRLRQARPVPVEVMEQLQKCHVLLKGPTTTPEAGAEAQNIESANVAIRKAFDLFANVRPVRVPSLGIDWVFFRENTEGEYILGSQGLMVTPDVAVDFKVITRPGAARIIRAAFEDARRSGKKKVTVVTKANVIKTTDGLFLEVAREVAKDFPDVEWDSWYVDIFAAKLIDEKRRRDFKVIVLPNLYGDIVTDEAAQFQGGVGTAGSANLGTRYAMFEAIHGSAPRMVKEGRGMYADPSSLMRAAAMMLEYVGLPEKARKLNEAMDVCCQYEVKVRTTGRQDGATARQFADYVIETVTDPRLEEKWRSFQDAQVVGEA